MVLLCRLLKRADFCLARSAGWFALCHVHQETSCRVVQVHILPPLHSHFKWSAERGTDHTLCNACNRCTAIDATSASSSVMPSTFRSSTYRQRVEVYNPPKGYLITAGIAEHGLPTAGRTAPVLKCQQERRGPQSQWATFKFAAHKGLDGGFFGFIDALALAAPRNLAIVTT